MIDKRKIRKECGSVAVEATIILPIAILSVVLLLYLSLFMFQSANLQAGLETTLVYYKNTITDNYITKNTELQYSEVGNDTLVASGNSYAVTGFLFPYANLLGDVNGLNNEDAFRTYFNSVAGNMLFSDDLELDVEYNNWVIKKELRVTAKQKIQLPIDFTMLGLSDTFTISSSARVNIVDHDQTIRNLDYAVAIVSDSALADLLGDFANLAVDVVVTIMTLFGGQQGGHISGQGGFGHF